MRTNQTDPLIADAISRHKAGLPEGYEVRIMRHPSEIDAKELAYWHSVIYSPKVRKMGEDTFARFLDDQTAIGYLVFNREYEKNRGLVAGVLMHYNPRYDRAVLDSRRRFEEVNEDDYQYETAAVRAVGVLPGEPKADEIKVALTNLAIYGAKEACFSEIMAPLWERDGMLTAFQLAGFSKSSKRIGQVTGWAPQVGYHKPIITPREYVNALIHLAGREWFIDEYLQGKAKFSGGSSGEPKIPYVLGEEIDFSRLPFPPKDKFSIVNKLMDKDHTFSKLEMIKSREYYYSEMFPDKNELINLKYPIGDDERLLRYLERTNDLMNITERDGYHHNVGGDEDIPGAR